LKFSPTGSSYRLRGAAWPRYRLAALFPDLVDGHDVRVVQTGGRLGLGAEALNVRRGGQLAGEDHFEGDQTVEAHLPGFEDHAHAAPAEDAEDLIAAEGRQSGVRYATRGLRF